MNKAKGWQGVDGSDTALLLLPNGSVRIWTNCGEWIEVDTEDELPAVAAQNLADGYGLEPMHPDRVAHLMGWLMSEDEAAGYGDSQER